MIGCLTDPKKQQLHYYESSIEIILNVLIGHKHDAENICTYFWRVFFFFENPFVKNQHFRKK